MKTHDLRHNWQYNSKTRCWECACLLSSPSPLDGFCANKIGQLRLALAPAVVAARVHRLLGEVEQAAALSERSSLTVADVLRIDAALRGDSA